MPAGSRAPEGGDRAVDEPGIDGRERLVAQTERLHRPRPEVLDQDVAPAHESRQHLGALRRLEVERDRALVAVDDEVRRRLALLVGRPGARLVARARVLHFDDVGAQVREQHAAEGAGQGARAIDATDAVEREGRARHVRYYTSMSTLRDALRQKILVLDGAMGTMIQAAGLRAEDFGGARYEGCNAYLTLTRPDVIREVHAAYLEAGADLISTNTFGCAPYVLGEYGLAERAYEIARAAARLAREVAGTRFVVGAMGPGTRSISVTRNVTFDEVREAYAVQARGLLDEIGRASCRETQQDTLNTKAAAIGVRRAMREAGVDRPLMVSGTIEPTGTR